jgi:hypothetical protein
LKNKHFNAIAIYGDVPLTLNLEVPERASAVGRAMISIVGPATWKQKEGVWYGDILRDLNTPGIVGYSDRYMNGVRLRGLYCQISLNFTGDEEQASLFSIMVMSTNSERSM